MNQRQLTSLSRQFMKNPAVWQQRQTTNTSRDACEELISDSQVEVSAVWLCTGKIKGFSRSTTHKVCMYELIQINPREKICVCESELVSRIHMGIAYKYVCVLLWCSLKSSLLQCNMISYHSLHNGASKSRTVRVGTKFELALRQLK